MEAFLCLPFKKQKYQITEGWHYSEGEKAVHGFSGHGAIDFALPRGAEVLAAADGFAMASYFGYPLKKDGKPKLHKGKPVGFGLGYFVQIYHPGQDLFTTYAHLESIDPKIPFYKPRKKGDHLFPFGHKIDPKREDYHTFTVKVKKGEVLGFVGDSGITWGYADYPKRPSPKQFPSWDEVHLHFEVFQRVGSRKVKKYFDPFGIKGGPKDYPDSFKKGSALGEKSPLLWVLDKNGLPQFAGNLSSSSKLLD